MQLRTLPGLYAIVRLPADANVPVGVETSAFSSITRTADELSIVCESRLAPKPDATVKIEGDWRCFRVVGTLDFSLTGILARLATPLALAEISIFAISTFDTDFVLVKAASFAKAQDALETRGFTFDAETL